MGKKSEARAEHERRHGNLGWKPCARCNVSGVVPGGRKCIVCGGIGFVPRDDDAMRAKTSDIREKK